MDSSDRLSFAEYHARLRARADELKFDRLVLEHGGLVLYRFIKGVRPIALVSGVHGDERSGPISVLRWLEELDSWPDRTAFWMVPLLNDVGWDKRTRDWKDGINLNSTFLPQSETTPEFVRTVMHFAEQNRPGVYLDLHEDDTVAHHYVFRNVYDTHGFSEALQAELNAVDQPWESDFGWEGCSEVFIRSLACTVCATLEAAPAQGLDERVDWFLRALRWTFKEGLRFLPSQTAPSP